MSNHRKARNGLNLHHTQHFDIPPMKHETVIVPSVSQPAFGSYFIIDFKEKHILLHDIALQFTVSPITGFTNANNYPHFAPAVYFFNRVEIVLNNNVIDTIYPQNIFAHIQLMNRDEQRLLINNAMGNYASASQRYNMSSQLSTYYVPLESFFKTAHMPLIHPHHDLQLRVYMNSLIDVVCTNGLSETAVASIQSCNLLAKISRLHSHHAQEHHRALMRAPIHHKFLETRYGIFNVPPPQAGSNSTILLTPFVGSVTHLHFVIRYSTVTSSTAVPNTQEGFTNYNPITSFSILDNTGTNITGGQVILSQYQLLHLNKEWTQSSYTSETQQGITNNNSYIYMYSFSADPHESHKTGVAYNSHRFIGNEQLQLTFANNAYSNAEVVMFAMCEAAVEHNHQYAKKISL